MPQLQEVKKQLIAGQATKTFDFFIQWHLTERCNLNCRHCYQKRRKPSEMSNSELKQEIDGVMEMFADWEKEHDVVLTNGSLVKAEDAAKASRLGVMDIQVSLEGPPEIHDAIRGSGSFDAAVKGVRLLIEAGNKVFANMTLSGLNIARIEETTDIARKIGFSGMGFSRLVPCAEGIGA